MRREPCAGDDDLEVLLQQLEQVVGSAVRRADARLKRNRELPQLLRDNVEHRFVRFRAEHYKDFCHTMPQVERERAYIKRLLLASVHAIKRLQKTLDLLLREGEENLARFFPSGAEGVVDAVSCRNPLYKSVRVQKPQLGRKRLGSNLELLFERAEIYLPA